MKTQNPWMGRMKGSAGSMTGCKVYDKNVMRAKAFEVSNPKTQSQQTERGFFALLIAAVATLSDAQLRTLYPQKPKTKSRRNMLTTQLSSAFSVDGTTKSLDFAEVLTIGNGPKTDAAMYHVTSVANETIKLEETAETLGLEAESQANFILVIFNATTSSIMMVNTAMSLVNQTVNLMEIGCSEGDEVYFFPSVEAKGEDVYLRGFGSFIIKTRAEKKGRQINKGGDIPPTPTIDLPEITSASCDIGEPGGNITIQFAAAVNENITVSKMYYIENEDIPLSYDFVFSEDRTEMSAKLAGLVYDNDECFIKYSTPSAQDVKRTFKVTVE